jgi:23S rRNA (uridine2552-2'-O)-methyltransferase
MSNKSWYQARLKDPFLLKARKENYRSRAAYKLQEMLEKYPLCRSGNKVLDVGAAPGSWTQVLLEKVGTKGLVIGVDLLPIEELAGAHLLTGDICDLAVQESIKKLCPQPFDAIFSDMAPNTTGIHHADTGQSVELVNLVLDLCPHWLKTGGHFIAKVFEGAEYKELHTKVKSLFGFAKSYKPSASLAQSREIYLIGQDYRRDKKS